MRFHAYDAGTPLAGGRWHGRARPPRALPALRMLLAALCGAGVLVGQTARDPLALPTPAATTAETTAETTGAAPLALPAAGQKVAPAERRAGALRDLARLDAARSELEARAAALAPQVDAAFVLVRDEIALDSYSGVLRGAQGTYAERAGNALDRALLLADLLRRKGHTVRFARGRLADARVQELVERLFAPRSAATATAPGDGARDAGAATSPQLLRRVLARAQRDYAALQGALGAADPGAVADASVLSEELRDHFWVQVRDGERGWVDLDSAFTAFGPGQRAAEVEQTWDRLPAELYQTLTVRVAVDEIVDGRLAPRTLLEVARPAWQWLEEQVVLVHVPQQRLGDAIAGRLGAGSGTPWAPLLQVGDEAFAGEAFRAGVVAAAGGFADVLDTPAEPAAVVGPAAEWLELELRFPDGRVEVHRRALLDRVPASARAAGTVDASVLQALALAERGPCFCLGVHSLGISAGRGDAHAFAEAVAWLCACLEPTSAGGEAGASAPAVEAAPDAALDALWPFSLQLRGWQMLSEHRIAPALNDRPGVRFYADAPRVWIASLVADAARPDDFDLVLDLRRDRLRGVVREPGDAPAVLARKLWFALLEGALEHEVLAETAVASAAADPRAVQTTSSSLSASGVHVLRREADLATAPALAEHPRALVAAALGRGSAVVVPAAPAHAELAFWEIEPNGDARAVFGDDWNGASVDLDLDFGRVPVSRPSSLVGGSRTSPVGRGGLNSSGGSGGVGGRPPSTFDPRSPGGGRFPNRPGGGPRGPRGAGRGGGSEYATLLNTVAIPAAYGWFVVGLAVEVTGGYIVALLMDAGMV